MGVCLTRPEFPAPLAVAFNKSHSGSRLLARLLQKAGVFLGAHLNDSLDAWDLLPVVRYLVTRHYPDFDEVLRGADPLVAPMLEAALQSHLEGFRGGAGAAWGWKLCETVFVVPVVAQVWPEARFIHLVRDGRDVAFSDHTGPTDAFWRKVYFGRDDVSSWRGMGLDGPSYRRRPHLFNALHWASSVREGRRHARALGERVLEVRYEDLCSGFDGTAQRICGFLGVELEAGARDVLRATVGAASVGKFRSRPRRQVREVLEIIGELQAELGYPVEER